jgi:hypothetical protein
VKRQIPLSFDQSGAVLERLEDLPIVLIGGQALNCWCQLYAPVSPVLAGQVFTSKDIDFQGTGDDMNAAADRLGASIWFSKEPPLLGYLMFDPDGNGEARIDFLAFPKGPLSQGAVREAAITVPVTGGHRVKVMHPFHCMVSRIANVVELPKQYDNEHGNAQLLASIHCMKAFVQARVRQGDTRGALADIEDVFAFCSQEPIAREIYRAKSVDPFALVTECEGLPRAFYEIRLPQLKAALVRART